MRKHLFPLGLLLVFSASNISVAGIPCTVCVPKKEVKKEIFNDLLEIPSVECRSIPLMNELYICYDSARTVTNYFYIANQEERDVLVNRPASESVGNG